MVLYDSDVAYFACLLLRLLRPIEADLEDSFLLHENNNANKLQDIRFSREISLPQLIYIC